MNSAAKIALYAAALAVAFVGAFGIGNLTGDPVEDVADQHTDDGHAAGGTAIDGPADDAADDHTADGHAHDDAETPAADLDSVPAGLASSASGYTLSPVDAPGAVDTDGELSFSIVGPDGEPVTDFTTAHEKDLHLIVVRTDGTGFRHVHPSMDADGTWSIDWEWDAAGTYKVFADFVPSDLGDGLTLAQAVHVGGEYRPAPLPPTTLTDEVHGYEVTLHGELVAGEESLLTATVQREGHPVTELEPYLGAYGHLVVLRDGDLAYVHVHPDGTPDDGVTPAGPDVPFHIEAPTPGTYRLFLDFKAGGDVHTAAFTMTTGDAADGPHGADLEHDADGGHDDADDPHGADGHDH